MVNMTVRPRINGSLTVIGHHYYQTRLKDIILAPPPHKVLPRLCALFGASIDFRVPVDHVSSGTPDRLKLNDILAPNSRLSSFPVRRDWESTIKL